VVGSMVASLLSFVLLGPPGEEPQIDAPVLVESASAERPDARPDEAVSVLLLLEIDESGQVVQVDVLESGGEPFDNAAVSVAREFVFEPAREDGIAIAVEIGYRYEFPPAPQPDPEPEPEPEPEPAPAPTIVDDSDVVQARRIEPPIAATRMDRALAEQTAGALGDVGKALESVGGVAQPSLTGGELVIWGASPSDTRTYVDWIPIPRLFHLGGARSNLPGAMVSAIELVPAGFAAGYGRAIGGMVRVETRAPRGISEARSVGAHARVDPIDVGAGMDTRLGQRGWLGVGLRRSLLRQTYGQLLPAASRELVPLPDTWDYQTKATLQLNARDALSLLIFGVHDTLTRTIPSSIPDQSFAEDHVAGFHRIGVALSRLRADGSSLQVSTWVGFDHDQTDQRFVDARALDRSQIWAGGLRVDERRRVARLLVLAAGLDLEHRYTQTTREGALSLPPREGDVVVFGQHPGDRVARDDWGVHQASLAAHLALVFGPHAGNWTIEPGVRVEPMVSIGDRVLPVRPIEPEVGYNQLEVAVDPRLSARWAALDVLELFAAGGRYHRLPTADELSPIFGNPRLRAIEAVHAVAGLTTKPARWLNIELTGFWIGSRHLPVRSIEPTPAVASAVVSDGQGRNVGGQLSGRARPGHGLLLFVAYTLQRAERSRPGADGPIRRLFDDDQTHVLQALAAWTHKTGVELGARASVSSGNPRTPVEAAVFDAVSGRYDPVFGEQNSIRLPTFFELSLRVGWGRQFAWGSVRTWLDVRNVSNQRNATELFYSSDFSSRGYVTGLPVVPVVGLEISR
jgi:TonB family protein